jgi:hypothetical protein
MTYKQSNGVKALVETYLSPLFQDNQTRNKIVYLILDDVIADIDETADWSNLGYDEINIGDVEIALARVLETAIVFNYTGE